MLPTRDELLEELAKANVLEAHAAYPELGYLPYTHGGYLARECQTCGEAFVAGSTDVLSCGQRDCKGDLWWTKPFDWTGFGVTRRKPIFIMGLPAYL